MAYVGRFLVGCLAVCTLSSAYPMYGPKRYRNYSPLSLPLYGPRTPRPYAPAFPYSQDLQDVVDIYSQDPYRFFPQVPYYFPETSPYYYDDEEIQEDEQDPTEQDIYTQDWYNQDGNAKANAFFLQNLILAQMYKDAQARHPVTYGYPRDDVYAREDYDDYVYGEPVVKGTKEDDDVEELKSLVTSKSDSSKRQQLKKKIMDAKAPRFSENTWNDEKRSSEKKGQEEMVMPRPANPVRTPVFHQRSHEPSPYDAIKKLLNVQSHQVRYLPSIIYQ